MTTATTTRPPASSLDAYLGVVQFLFLLTWVVYAVFLEELLARLGLPKHYVPLLLMLDQGLFALADLALGYSADRLLRAWGRAAPLLVALNLTACLAFVALPHAAAGMPALFLGLTVFWVLSASVLRAPLYGLIARRAAQPGRGTAGALLGMGLAAALAPYLGQALKGIDPMLPFTLAGVALAATSLGFSGWENRLAAANPASAAASGARDLARWFGAALLLGLGFQLHFFVNAAPLFKAVADASLLPWLIPAFWIGFSLAVYPGADLARRLGSRRLLAAAAGLGTVAVAGCATQPGLAALILLQALAGTAWGAAFLAGIAVAGEAGRVGREALYVGAWFAGLALAALIRIALTLAGFGYHNLTLLLAAVLWLAASLLLSPWLAKPVSSS